MSSLTALRMTPDPLERERAKVRRDLGNVPRPDGKACRSLAAFNKSLEEGSGGSDRGNEERHFCKKKVMLYSANQARNGRDVKTKLLQSLPMRGRYCRGRKKGEGRKPKPDVV